MSEPIIYLAPGGASISNTGLPDGRHISIFIVEDGKTLSIDGMQSEGFGIEHPQVPVNNKRSPIYGNAIVITAEFNAELTPADLVNVGYLEVVQLSFPPGEAAKAVADIKEAITDVGPAQSYTVPGDENDGALIERKYYDYDVAYSLLGPNSNSVANTILSSAGINMKAAIDFANFPNISSDDFVGNNIIIDMNGDNEFIAFHFDNFLTETTVFQKRDGNDTILLEYDGVENDHAELELKFDNLLSEVATADTHTTTVKLENLKTQRFFPLIIYSVLFLSGRVSINIDTALNINS